MQQWDKPMNYSDQAVDEARAKEDAFKNLFGAVKAVMRTDWRNQTQGWTTAERDLWAATEKCQSVCHTALADNFNTPRVMTELSELCTEMNKYMKARGNDSSM